MPKVHGAWLREQLSPQGFMQSEHLHPSTDSLHMSTQPLESLWVLLAISPLLEDAETTLMWVLSVADVGCRLQLPVESDVTALLRAALP